MDVIFRTTKMKKLSENYKELTRKYGSKQAEKIMSRINELIAAENLHDIDRLPQARLHPLSGKLKGMFATDIKHPYRLIIKPLNGEMEDYKTISKIEIEDLYIDYH